MSKDTPAPHRDYLLILGAVENPRLFSGTHNEPSLHALFLTEEEAKTRTLRDAIEPDYIQSYTFALLKKLRGVRPGAVFLVTKTEAGIKYTPKDWPQFYLTAPAIEEYSARHTAVLRQWEAEQRIEKAAKVWPHRESLRPVQDAYHSLHGAAKAQLIAEVVAFITRKERA